MPDVPLPARALSEVRNVPESSMPKWSKKRRSSVASHRLDQMLGMSSSVVDLLCLMPRLPISLP